ncbi:MAG: hypothetical protein JWQ71_1953, partial [Pedosphaera sp.]|nr:hypothetical protein [Pedosphaera sp.]
MTVSNALCPCPPFNSSFEIRNSKFL